jgi:hypothetical protein
MNEHSLKMVTPYINKEVQGLNRTYKMYYSGKIGEISGQCPKSR